MTGGQQGSSQRGSRSRARRQALQILYQSEISGVPVPKILTDRTYSTVEVAPSAQEGADEVLVDDVPLEDYAMTLALGVHEHLKEIDRRHSDTSQNWKLYRMATVDRNILRLAVYEISYCDEVPVAVAINEAVEVARAFAGDESTKFINGVLGTIATQDAEQEQSGLPAFDPSKLPSDQVIGSVEDVVEDQAPALADEGSAVAQEPHA